MERVNLAHRSVIRQHADHEARGCKFGPSVVGQLYGRFICIEAHAHEEVGATTIVHNHWLHRNDGHGEIRSYHWNRGNDGTIVNHGRNHHSRAFAHGGCPFVTTIHPSFPEYAIDVVEIGSNDGA